MKLFRNLLVALLTTTVSFSALASDIETPGLAGDDGLAIPFVKSISKQGSTVILTMKDSGFRYLIRVPGQPDRHSNYGESIKLSTTEKTILASDNWSYTFTPVKDKPGIYEFDGFSSVRSNNSASRVGFFIKTSGPGDNVLASVKMPE